MNTVFRYFQFQAHIRTTAASIQALDGRQPLSKMGDDMDLLASRKAPAPSVSHNKGYIKVSALGVYHNSTSLPVQSKASVPIS